MAKLPNFSGRHWLVGISLVGLSLSGFATTYSTQFNQVGSTWGSGFQAQIISPEKIGNFVLSFTYPKEYAISGYWGGDGLQQSQNCDSVSCTYQFKGYAYNAPLNFGYVVSYAGKTAIVAQPTNIQLTDNANPQDAGVPATPQLSFTSVASSETGKSNVDVKWDIWWGNNGRSFQLFENDKLVDSGDLTANSPNAQTHTSTLTNRAPGTYSYKVVVTNSKGSVTATNSYTVTDYGTAPTPPAPPVTTSSISISPGDSTTQQVAQLVVKQGQTASFNLNEDGVKSPQYRLTFSNPGVIKSSQVSAQGVMTLTASDQLGRTALKIEDPNTHAVRYVGIVTVDKNNNRPGLPTYLAVGSVSQDDTATINFWQQFGPGETNKRVDIRYIYLNNGPYNGWSTWGNRVPTFVNNSLKLGMIPFFVYYNINNGSDSLYAIKENMQNKDFMEAYFKDLKLAVTQAKTAANGERVGFVLEADMLGYFQQAEPNKSPKEQPVLTNAAYSSGVLDANDPQFENNITGLVKAINYIIRKYDSTAILGWQLNLWANPQDNGGTGIIHATDSCNQTDATCIAQARQKIINNAKGLMQYGLAAEINYKADFVSIDKYGLDGGQQANAKNSPEKSTWFWNATLWNNYLLFVNTLHQESNLPIVLWQIPVGHINSPTSISPYSNQPFAVLPNTNAKYEDSAGTFFLGDSFSYTTPDRNNSYFANAYNDSKVTKQGNTITWQNHMQETANAGVAAILFGAGVGDSTQGTPAPTSGDTNNPTDDYWWISKVQEYYKNTVKAIVNIN